MRRIDDEVRETIKNAAEEIEEEGGDVNRRALAREFGVSPQTVARILDGPDARRGGNTSGLGDGLSTRWLLAGAALTTAVFWWLLRSAAGGD